MDHKIMIRADAKAMGAVTALSTRVTDRWASSKPSQRTFGGRPFTGTSECISYKADGTASVFAPARENIHRKQRQHVQLSAARERQLAAQERLAATLASHAIGNVE